MPSLKSMNMKKKNAAADGAAIIAAMPPAVPASSQIPNMKRMGSGVLSGRKPSPTNRQRKHISQSVSFGQSNGDSDTNDSPPLLEEAATADEDDNDDPLLSLFRVHNTNRVKFDLNTSASDSEGAAEAEEEEDDNMDQPPITNTSSPSPSRMQGASQKLKNFVRVRSASFKSKKSHNGDINTPADLTASCLLSKDTFDEDDEEENALIKKMLEPPAPLRKISSFLGSRRGGNNSSEDKAIHGQDSLEQSPLFDTIEGVRKSTINNNGTNSSRIPKSTKESIAKLLKKAKRHHRKSFRYKFAMKYYLLALKEMTNANYPDSDPLMTSTLKSLNDVHHAQSTVANSANIVQMGIQHEDKNQLIKALRMYTIAYRMRRDSLGVDHPSLAVLLNMMGSVQVKRGEYGEAMKIYELSLKGRPDENGGRGRKKDQFREQNPLTTSVTLRDMGMILEHKGNEEKALKFYHASLKYAVKFKDSCEQRSNKISSKGSDVDGGSDAGSANAGSDAGSSIAKASAEEDDWLDTTNTVDDSFSLNEVRMAKSITIGKNEKAAQDNVGENGEMELFLEKRFDRWALSSTDKTNSALSGKSDSTKFYYDDLFSSTKDDRQQQQMIIGELQGEGSDIDIAMTLHQIGQIHRRSHRYGAALSAYNASLRGMKEVLGAQHGNIAAILGNIGNLYMETGDYDEAFGIYQEVLGIETMHLGLSHPEVAVTLHNIATIECSRGNFEEGVSLYKQVVDMQKIRYGSEHLTVAITLSCLADAYEKLRNTKGAIKAYTCVLKIRITVLGESHLDVGRLMHKLGRLASSKEDYAVADIYMSRAEEIYKENGLRQDHVFMREMERDDADIRAGLAFGVK